MNHHLQTVVDFVKTERMQVILILLFVLLSAFLTVNFVVLPQRDMTEENQNVREKLKTSYYVDQSFTNMQMIAGHEHTNLSALSNEWLHVADRLMSLSNSVPSSIIDYKRMLYDVRESLRSKSKDLNITLLPGEFMDDAITSDEDVRTRILQLRTVELLANLALDRKIQQLVEIYPLPPIQHVDTQGKKTFVEYPVRVECDVEFGNLYTFFQSVFEEDQFFTFRNIRIESGPTFQSKLRMKAILSTLLFE